MALVGRTIELRPAQSDLHCENCFRWLNDVEITANLAIGWRPITMAMEIEHFQRLCLSQTDVLWAIHLLNGAHIGMCGIHGIDYRLGLASTGIFIGEPEYWNKGIATEAAHLRSYQAFYQIGLRILYSEFYTGNTGSATMQEKVGYKIWGTQPAANFRNGQYLDVVHTYLTREMWRKNTPDWLAERYPLVDPD